MTRHLEPVDDDQAPIDYDEAAEQAVLGAMLTTPDAITNTTDIATTADYYLPRHQTIHAAITRLHAAGDPTGPIAVLADLRTRNELRASGGGHYLHQLLADAPTPSQAPFYARTVAKHSRTRTVREHLTKGLQQLNRGQDPDAVDTAIWQVLSELTDPLDRAKAQKTSWTPHDLAAVLAGHDDTVQPTILERTDGNALVYPGAIHTFSGEPESGKTWIALLATAQQLRAGQRVVYIDFEDQASRVIGRLVALGAHPDHIRDQLTYVRPHSPIDVDARALLEPRLTRATLAVVDGVTEAMTSHGLDLENNADIARFYDLLPRWITRHGPACILIDHVVKDPERQGRWGIGGQHKLAGIDGAAYTVKAISAFGRGEYGQARITLSKDREGAVAEYALGRTAGVLHIDARDPIATSFRIEPAHALPTDNRGDARPTILMEAVSRWLEAHPGATKNEVVAEVKGRKEYKAKALAALIHEGHIEVTKGPSNAQLHRVVDPFRNTSSDPSDKPLWED